MNAGSLAIEVRDILLNLLMVMEETIGIFLGMKWQNMIYLVMLNTLRK